MTKGDSHTNKLLPADGLPRSLMASFGAMCICFSINHGCVTALIPLATGDFGSLGSYTLGTLYAFYTLTALFFSTAIVGMTGHKWGMVLGMSIYCGYVALYLVARETSGELRAFSAVTGGVMGGVAAGFLWTAQGGYFTNLSAHYAASKGITRSEATSWLSGIFASFYLGGELLMKLLSSFLQYLVCIDAYNGDLLTGHCTDAALKDKGQLTVYSVFTVAAVVSSVLMAFVSDLPPAADKSASPAAQMEKRPFYTKLFLAFDLLRNSKKMALLAAINIEFGFIAAWLNTYVTTVIKMSPQLGADKVGYFVAIIPAVATAMSIPISSLSSRLGTKVPVMLMGSACFLLFVLPFNFSPNPVDDLGSWAVLVPFFMVYGVGRAVWEGPNKAVIADFFPESPEAAFANLILQNGSASALAFFLFPSLSVTVQQWLVVVFGVLAMLGYLAANKIHQSEQLSKAAGLLEGLADSA